MGKSLHKLLFGDARPLRASIEHNLADLIHVEDKRQSCLFLDLLDRGFWMKFIQSNHGTESFRT